MAQERRFPSPFEVEPIPGTEGWERMYPYYFLFSPERKEYDESQLWFFDSMHYPQPLKPFELIGDILYMAVSAYTSRVFAIPPANGIGCRIIHGYRYASPQGVADPKEMEERVPLFQKRTGFYYEHWNELYDNWVPKMKALIAELKQIEFKDLPKYDHESVVLQGKGITSGYLLLEKYNRFTESMIKCWQYHFEFLNLVYLAYVMFFDFCTKAFPEIHPNTISKMVSGMGDVMMFRPEEELGKLAQLAVYLGVGDVFKKGLPPEETISELQKTNQGKRWLDAMEHAKDPWFYTSSGSGFYHTDPAWIDDLSIPFGHLKGYIQKIERGESLERPTERIIEERERLHREYRELLASDEDRKTFDQSYETLSMVYPYAENHIFFVEHWFQSIFWQKARELGRVLANAGFFQEADDLFYFFYTDVPPMLIDLAYSWSLGGAPARGPGYWPREVAWRKGVFKKFQEWTPPPALGPVPEKITEPFTIQLWGITSETMDTWLAPRPKAEEVTELKGFPASTGVAEGPARVITEVGKLDELQPGEILVCGCTSPSWAPAFPKIKAAVTDLGGMSCHAAIVAREYGLPCVAGTGYATVTIKTGDMLKVDGTAGIVTIKR